MVHILTNTYTVIDPWFGREHCPLELDLGCGKGRFTLELAARYPERLVLGSDVMLGRLRRVARQVGQRGLGNIELLRVNNRELAAFQLPDACLRRIHLLCPDPWPKARHRANRLVTTDFLTRLGRVLEPGGVLHVATDHVPYLEDMARIIGATGCFASAPGAIADIADLRTDFELVWERAGREVEHLAYVSRAGGLQLGGRAAGDRAGHGSRQRR